MSPRINEFHSRTRASQTNHAICCFVSLQWHPWHPVVSSNNMLQYVYKLPTATISVERKLWRRRSGLNIIWETSEIQRSHRTLRLVFFFFLISSMPKHRTLYYRRLSTLYHSWISVYQYSAMPADDKRPIFSVLTVHFVVRFFFSNFFHSEAQNALLWKAFNTVPIFSHAHNLKWRHTTSTCAICVSKTDHKIQLAASK